jgi:hypothetical protein
MGVIRSEFERYNHNSRQRLENTMTSKQLEKQRQAVKAQIRWATLYDGDEELLSLLCIESARLSMKIGQCHDLPAVGGRPCENVRQTHVAEKKDDYVHKVQNGFPTSSGVVNPLA